MQYEITCAYKIGEEGGHIMANTIKITTPSFKLNKKGEIDFPTKKWEVPANVVDIAYFQYACQYWSFNHGSNMISSKVVQAEYEKVDTTIQKLVDAHNKKVNEILAIQDNFKSAYTKWMDNIPDDLMTEFKNDIFARTFTAVKLGFYSYSKAVTNDRGETNSKSYLTSGIFPSMYEDKTLKAYGLNLEDLLSRDNVKKVDKQEAYKPFHTILSDSLFPTDTDNIRYKKGNFHNMSQRYYSVWLSSLRGNAKQKFIVKDPTTLSQNLAYIGMAWLKVVKIEDLEAEVESGYTLNDIKKRA